MSCTHNLSRCCFPLSLSSSISNSLWSHLCSSCLKHPGKVHFVFNVVEFPACSGRPAGRRGLCTGWLFDLINPGLVFPGKAECSGSLTLPKVMSTLENRGLKLECANLWALGWLIYFSVFESASTRVHRCFNCYNPPLRWRKNSYTSAGYTLPTLSLS